MADLDITAHLESMRKIAQRIQTKDGWGCVVDARRLAKACLKLSAWLAESDEPKEHAYIFQAGPEEMVKE